MQGTTTAVRARAAEAWDRGAAHEQRFAALGTGGHLDRKAWAAYVAAAGGGRADASRAVRRERCIHTELTREEAADAPSVAVAERIARALIRARNAPRRRAHEAGHDPRARAQAPPANGVRRHATIMLALALRTLAERHPGTSEPLIFTRLSNAARRHANHAARTAGHAATR